jgi:hypothetical protein
MQVQVRVGEKAYDGTIKEVLQINEATLTDEFIRQPSTYAYFAALSEFAVADVEQKKLSFSVLKANLDGQKRLELAKLGKVTESMVDSAIILDKKYQIMFEEVIEAERQLGILKSLVKALEQRKDMLIQLGSTKRQEMTLQDFGINVSRVKNNNQ